MSTTNHLPTITEQTFSIVSQMLSREGVKNPDAKTVARYIEKVVAQEALTVGDTPSEKDQSPQSFYEGLSEDGLIGKYDNMPADLSSNPVHMDEFGR